MAHDDRQRDFEKALARTLHAESAGAVKPQNVCADAETLAAYHESSLAPEQMVSLTQHIAGCARCEEIVKQLAATEEIPLEVPLAERVAERSVQIVAPKRMRYWQWLVPAGALAAGLLVWISTHQPTPHPLQIAKNQGSSPAAAQPLASSRPPEGKAKESMASGGVAGQSPQAPSADSRMLKLPKPLSLGAKKSDSLVPAPPGRDAGRPAAALNGRLESSLDKAEEPSVTAKNALIAGGRKDLGKQTSADAFAAAPATPAPSPNPPARQVVQEAPAFAESVEVAAAPAAAPQTKRAKVAAASAEVAPQVPPREISRMAVGGAALHLANSKMPAMISAPGGISLWRVGAAGKLEHSIDSGATWTLQTSGVIADLIAGSAPSDKICWVVGRSGTIVRTTDGGATWTSVRSPISDDLRAVFAVNAEQATIFATQDAYQTTDSGLSWTKLAPKK